MAVPKHGSFFERKVGVVTGAGNGIGRCLALQLAASGARLALCDVDITALEDTAELCRAYELGGVLTMVVDVRDGDALQTFADRVASRFGGVDYLFNNAGVASGGLFGQESAETFDWVMDINLNGLIRCTRVFMPHLINTERGAVVNLSSVAGLMGSVGMTAYCTTKYGVRGFSESLLADTRAAYPQLSVVSVHPGMIGTEIVSRARLTPKSDEGTEAERKAKGNSVFTTCGMPPTQAAWIILNGVRRGKTRILVGTDALWSDFMVRLMPRGILKIQPIFLLGFIGGMLVDRFRPLWKALLVLWAIILLRRRPLQ